MARKICMLSSNHSLLDDRIYWKEALSLHKNGYEVCHIGKGEEAREYTTPEGIKLIEIPSVPSSKVAILFKRPSSSYQKIFELAKKEKADAYQFHDWRLNIIGKQLKQLPHKPKVIYDAHEATADLFLMYKNEQSFFRKTAASFFSKCVAEWELHCAKNYDHIITAEEAVAAFFAKVKPAKQITCIHNY
ncbi:MAG: glycosyltransferase, partial [Chitinophagaceae bacterium]|nr:glycosyltransferase [Chitinophagaceae bacterium]